MHDFLESNTSLSKAYTRPFFPAISVAMFNQLDGTNVLLYYLNPIFEMAGFTKVSANLQAMAIGTADLV